MHTYKFFHVLLRTGRTGGGKVYKTCVAHTERRITRKILSFSPIFLCVICTL